MDINLPDMTGLEALAILQDDPSTARIPVIALTANAMPRDIKQGLKAGFLRYLTKPIKLGEFMAALDAGIEASEIRPGRIG
jgi:CheY-like chemotaxis protein